MRCHANLRLRIASVPAGGFPRGNIRIGADGDAPEADTASILYAQPGERIYITLPSGTGLKYYDDSRSADFPFTAEGLEHEPGYVFFDFSPEEISLSAYSAATGEEIDAVTLRRGAPITEEE